MGPAGATRPERGSSSHLICTINHSTLLLTLISCLDHRQRAGRSGIGTRDSGLGARDSRHGTRDSGLGTRDSGHGTRDSGHETRDSRLGTRDSGLGTRDSGHGTRDSGLGTREAGRITRLHLPIRSILHHPAHYPIVTSPHYPIKNALWPWGLASVPALLIFHHTQGHHFGK